MKERLIAIRAKIDALSLRERALVLFSALAVIYLVWDMFLFNPVAVAKADFDKKQLEATQKIEAMEQEERVLLATLASDPDRELKQTIDSYEKNIARLDQELAEVSRGLVPVQQLTHILQEVLVKTGQLSLRQLQTLPAQALELSTPDVASTAKDSSQNTPAKNSSSKNTSSGQKPAEETKSAGIYKHAVHLEIEGSYLQVLTYLRVLETMQWRFYWEELRFSLEEYPRGVIHVKVYTLSTDEGLFGV